MDENIDWQSSQEEQQLDEEEREQEQEGEEQESSQEQEVDNEAGKGGHYNDRPTKRSKNCLDRISELPDSVLTYILSLLPTRDAVKTSALSKRWRHTWALISSLIYLCNTHESLSKFIEFVDATLILHRSSKISKFVLLLTSRDRLMDSKFQLWVHAAVIKEVEELSIKFNTFNYWLPQSLYLCNSLTKLSLSNCWIAPNDSTVDWRLLKHLTITNAPLEGGVLQKLLTGSPLLETLKLKNCKGFDQIDINSQRLRRLVINGYIYNSISDHRCLEISAPSLQSLEILGSMDMKKCRLKNVSSLFHASLTFYMSSMYDYSESDEEADFARVEDLRNMVRDLMERVRHVQHITIGTWIVQALSRCELDCLPSSILMYKCLVLKIDLCEHELPGIASLLRSSPVLERLVIDLLLMPEDGQILHFEDMVFFGGKNYWTSKQDMFSQSLKIVEISGFSEFMPEFVRFVLHYAKALEKLVIKREIRFNEEHWVRYFGQDNFFKVVQQLLSFPRSSAHAQILLL
ncbi:hypothetical protein Cgig2_019043 [Carnegiea gigantea]|uniref:F-box domain-containing protein n=1 Tax=Carnegiea gigantea TaxID=171969 RepID=A0A9Q1JN47_9CARY|nr:hypothetical protein Cgig2_019043 [Carnegiea gigantea]